MIMLAVQTLISRLRKFDAMSLITTVYHVTNTKVADLDSYVIKLALDLFIFLTGISGSYKNKKF